MMPGGGLSVIQTLTENVTERGLELTNGQGFDLILDFGGQATLYKRSLLKLCGFLCRIVTSSDGWQLDPPEVKYLQSLSVTVSYINAGNLVESGMFDGQIQAVMKEVVERVGRGSNELRVWPVEEVTLQELFMREKGSSEEGARDKLIIKLNEY